MQCVSYLPQEERSPRRESPRSGSPAAVDWFYKPSRYHAVGRLPKSSKAPLETAPENRSRDSVKQRSKNKPTKPSKPREQGAATPEPLRVIGGSLRGSKLAYHGDQVTRPMKHRVREAIFNLVGVDAKGKHAIDVFAGTGALGIEAISRGAASATFIERHLPTAAIVKQNIASVGLSSQTELFSTSAFLWGKRDLPTISEQSELGSEVWSQPWLVFVSPPYAFFVEREKEMLGLIDCLIQSAPPSSLMVVEADERFDFAKLPGNLRADRHATGWDVRAYSPAIVGIAGTDSVKQSQ